MQRYFAKDIYDDKVILPEGDLHHIKHVMRMKNNDLIQVVFESELYEASIKNIDNEDIRIIRKLENVADKLPYITIIIPALKEQKMDLILQKCTEIGVNEFFIVPFERSIIKYDDRKEKVKLERWRKICKEASEQSMRIDIPLVNIENDLNFVKNVKGIKLICSTNEKQNYIKYALKNITDYDKITLVIGPEGGITEQEETYYEESGFKKITLGTQIMRVETVPIFLSSIIRYEFTE